MKTLAYLIIIISLGLFSFFGYVTTRNPDDVVNSIVSEIERNYKIKVSVGRVKIQAFPIPKIIIDKISAEKVFYALSSEISLSPFNIIKGSIKPEKIIIEHLNYSDDSSKIIENFSLLENNNANMLVNSIIIKKFTYGKNINTEELKNVKINLDSNNLQVELSTISDIPIKFSSSKEASSRNFKITINDPRISFNLSESEDASGAVSGKLFGEIKNLSSFSKSITNDFHFAINSLISSNESVKFEGEITSDDKFIVYNNIKFNGQNFNSNVILWLAKNKDTLSNLTINFDKLNLGKIIDISKITSFKDLNLNQFNSGNFDSLISIKGDIVNCGDEIINQLSILLDCNKEIINFKDCSGVFSSGGKFKLEGLVSHNNYRPKFDGNLFINHKDSQKLLSNLGVNSTIAVKTPLELMTKLTITPIDLVLDKFTFNLGKTKIKGQNNFKFLAKSPILQSDIQVINLNIDEPNLPFLINIKNYFQGFTEGLYESKYIEKFIPLRTLGIEGQIKINLENTTFMSQIIDDFNGSLLFQDGMIKLDKFKIIYANNILKGNSSIIATSLKPYFSLNIEDSTLSLNFSIIDYLLDLEKNSKDKYDFKKIILESSGSFNKLTYNETEIKNFKYHFLNQDTLFNSDNISGELLDGKFQISGNSVFNPFKINFAFGFDSFNINSLINKTIPNVTPFNNGWVSLNGQTSTLGSTKAELLYNLYAKGSFITKDINVNNFSIDKFIEDSSIKGFNIDNLKPELDKTINSGITIIPLAQGNFELNTGVLSIKDLFYKSKYASGSVGASINIYDNNMLLESYITFFPLIKLRDDEVNQNLVKLKFTVKNNAINPDKEIIFATPEDFKKFKNLVEINNSLPSKK